MVFITRPWKGRAIVIQSLWDVKAAASAAARQKCICTADTAVAQFFFFAVEVTKYQISDVEARGKRGFRRGDFLVHC